MDKELELWHFWPTCDKVGCWKCLWWDICYWLAASGARNDLKPPEFS